MKFEKNDHVVCVDEDLPISANHHGILKLGRVYKVVDVQYFPNMATVILQIQDINTKKTDWHHAGKFTVLKKEI